MNFITKGSLVLLAMVTLGVTTAETSVHAQEPAKVSQEVIANAANTKYTVVSGDTLNKLANKYNVSVSDIQHNNNIANPNLIFVGETFIVSGPDFKSNAQPTYTAPKEVVVEQAPKVVEAPAPVVEQAPAPVVEAPAPEVKQAPVQSQSGRQVTVQATAYSTNQPELSTHTATGIDLRNQPNVIAVDPSFIALGSRISIPGYGEFIAGDTGGAIKGNRIDVHITNLNSARNFGRQTMTITVLD